MVVLILRGHHRCRQPIRSAWRRPSVSPPTRTRSCSRATRPADLETPIGAFLRLDDGGPAYLLESVEGGERLGRYSFLGVGPRRLLEVSGGQARIQTRPVTEPTYSPDLPIETVEADDPLAAIRAFVPRRRVQPTDGMPRFTGGAVGALAYDAISAFEPHGPAPGARPGRRSDGRVHRDRPRPRLRPPDPHAVGDRLAPHRRARPRGSLSHRGGGHLRRARADGATERRGDERSAAAGRRRRDGRATGPGVRPRSGRSRPASGGTSTSTRSRSPRTRSRPARRSRSCSLDASRSSSRRTPRPGPRSTASGSTARSGGSTRARTSSSPGRRLRGRRRLAGAAAPGRGRPADHPPDRRHPAARRRRPRGRAARRGAPARPEGAGRARHARRPRPQRPRARGAGGHGHGQQVHGGRALQPRPAPRLARRGAAQARARRARRAALGLPGGHAVRRAQGPGDAAHRRRGRASGAGCTAAPSATSATTATSTPPSRSGARSSRTARPTSIRAPGSSPAPSRRRSSRRPSTRRRPSGGRSRWPPAWPRRRDRTRLAEIEADESRRGPVRP